MTAAMWDPPARPFVFRDLPPEPPWLVRWLRAEPRVDVLTLARMFWCYVAVVAVVLLALRASGVDVDHTRLHFTDDPATEVR